MNDDRQITAESRYNVQFLTHFNSKKIYSPVGRFAERAKLVDRFSPTFYTM